MKGLKLFILFRIFRSLDRDDRVYVLGRLLARVPKITPKENLRMSLLIAEQQGRDRRRAEAASAASAVPETE